MIKNDFRYIIKKILIGIGICVGLFYLKSCNVYALDDQWYTLRESQTQPSFPCFSNNSVYTYVINGNTYEFKVQNGGIYFNNNYVTSDSNVCRGFMLGTNPNNQVEMYYFTNQGYFKNVYSNFGSVPNYTEFPFVIDNFYNSGNVVKMVFNGSTLISSGTATCTNITLHNMSICSYINYNLNLYGMRMLQVYYNTNLTNKFYYTDFGTPVIIPPSTSTISTLTPTPILTDDDSVLLGYSFKFVFDNFDTTNFVYKYRVGNGPTLILSQNNFQTSIRENKTLYVWVENLDGDVIDNESFTISNIGSLYDGSYSIDITYNDIAPYDTQNTGGSKIINRVDIFLKYLPKTNYLKYQYQYVISGNNLDSHAWVTLNDNNTSVNEYTLPVHDNGTLYARILDSNDNVVDSTTFSVDSIGKLKLYGNSNNITSIFTKLKDNIDYSGPISSLILIPVEFLTTIYDSANGVCTSYNFGSLFGTNIVFPCVDLEDYLGSTLWSLIDILSSIGIIFGISRFIKKQYNKFTNLDSSDSDIM